MTEATATVDVMNSVMSFLKAEPVGSWLLVIPFFFLLEHCQHSIIACLVDVHEKGWENQKVMLPSKY